MMIINNSPEEGDIIIIKSPIELKVISKTVNIEYGDDTEYILEDSDGNYMVITASLLYKLL